jgi:hypothetical protein
MLKRGSAGASSGRFVSRLNAWLAIISSSSPNPTKIKSRPEIGDLKICHLGTAVGG